MCLRTNRALRVRAGHGANCVHTISPGDSMHAGAGLEDRSSAIKTGDIRLRWIDLMRARSNVGVNGIYPGSLHLNQHLRGAGAWLIELVEHELLRTAKRVHPNGFHAAGASSINCATRSISTQEPNG